jgi:hypothetical protein
MFQHTFFLNSLNLNQGTVITGRMCEVLNLLTLLLNQNNHYCCLRMLTQFEY